MRGRWLLVWGIVVLAGVAAGALFLLHRPPKSAVRPQEPALPSAAPAGEISVVGKIWPQHVVPIPAPISGTLEQFFADVGQEVFRGQLIARIRNEGLESDREAAAAEVDRIRSRVGDLESSIVAARLEATRARADAARAKSAYEKAEKNHVRQQTLLRAGATPRLTFEASQRELESAKADYEALEPVARNADDRLSTMRADLDIARRQLQNKNEALEDAKADLAAGEVHCPVDGVVISRNGMEGGEVASGAQELFQIGVDLSQLEAVAEPEAPVLDRIKAGQAAFLQIEEIAGQGLPGSVREIRGAQVIVDFVSPNPAIKPGLTAQVRIKIR
jgi:macrolide-specific efflux system membrane fusion protein